jgi:hypothetical protein
MLNIIAYFVKPKGTSAVNEQLYEAWAEFKSRTETMFDMLGYEYRITDRFVAPDTFVCHQPIGF